MKDSLMRPLSPSRLFLLCLVLAGLFLCASVNVDAAQMQRVLYGQILEAEKAIVIDRRPRGGGGAGSTVGAIAGYALSDPGDRWLGAVIGGVIGGAAGKSAAKRASRKKGWKLIIRLENGEEVGLDVPNRKDRFVPGDKVRILSSPQGTKVRKLQE